MTDAARTGDQEEARLVIERGSASGSAETFLIVHADGRVTGHNGHVDLGTGIATALAQIVAEELDAAPDQVAMVLGDTGRTPDQGPTIASETIQVAAVPLRKAAAQARGILLSRAARLLDAAPEDLAIEAGLVFAPGSNRRLGFGEILAGATIRAELDLATPVKPAEAYRLVGTSLPRVDIPDKVSGRATYVHDVRLPGMLHGRVVRPPYAGRDSGDFIGRSLLFVDRASVASLPGFVELVVIADFVGIVCEREDQAAEAARRLKIAWREPPPLPGLDDLAAALTAHPATPRTLSDHGDVEAVLPGSAVRLKRRYVWPYQMHASIGPSCAVADFRDGLLTLWSGTQNPHMLRGDLCRLLQLPPERIDIRRHEAAGCYGRNCADDVSADASLLSRAVGRPVRVQLTRAEEHAWEPKGAAQLIDVEGGLSADGGLAAYDFETRYPSNRGPNLALLLTGAISPDPQPSDMGDRTAIPPYRYAAERIRVHDMAPIVRASWMRGVSAMPNSFAHESFIDELAAAAVEDPVAFRLRHLKDPRAAELVRATAGRAGWVERSGPRRTGDGSGEGGKLYGQGFAYAVYVHGAFPGTAAAHAAWIAEVAVDRRTGEVALERVVVGHDTGQMINPAGVRHQIHGNVVQSASRVLKEEVAFENSTVASRDWGSYPIAQFPEIPDVDVLMLPRPADPPLGVGESASVPSAAAIANAIFDATGVRFRELPFTPERIKAGLDAAWGAPAPPARLEPAAPAPAPGTVSPRRRPPLLRRLLAPVLAGLAATIGTAAVGLVLRAPIAPVAPPDPATWSAATLERGRQLAALGDCAVCHTVPGGSANAGGRAIETPFGTVYSTNITPDPETGIGAWSYPAFARAMREGISRDGRHLYPAFPYSAFAKTGEADLEALYAHLMAQPPVRATPPATALAFPFNLRPLMAGWNALYHKAEALRPVVSRSEAWNRGRYLVEGLGHCSACHSPRNPLGAEKRGAAHLSGGIADGWHAPALDGTGEAPLGWTQDALYAYLRTGRSAEHGAAAGSMAPVVASLTGVPDTDIRAMAVYLASLSKAAPQGDRQAEAARLVAASEADIRPAQSLGARLYDGACAVCHRSGAEATLFNAGTPLALTTAVNAAAPDNLIRTIFGGLAPAASGAHSAMPGFAETFTDRQVAALVSYLRSRFARGRAPWDDVEARVAKIRASLSEASTAGG
ncbi:molybdopterin cofactor-binding domain-containing protein [Jiella sonneratiae]|uniref:Molybdopterin-dependent oxidoreductase n=1 Tax=Jiella sonneratiae TaxID=2816856 RepID=A0ABS3IXE5_9HYPH|nr:molybdopterin cofactor-binding domain-containing protein [Jiella sonneratiae]MBO0902082.1 molybdopterin-dependent oxidoreductase [Jiella sonneratiae]